MKNDQVRNEDKEKEKEKPEKEKTGKNEIKVFSPAWEIRVPAAPDFRINDFLIIRIAIRQEDGTN